MIEEQMVEVKEREDQLQREYKDKERIDGSDIHGLFFAFLNRARFRFTLADTA